MGGRQSNQHQEEAEKKSEWVAPERSYGWLPSLPDHRDKWKRFAGEKLDSTFALDVNVPVYNQGKLGSCTANAIACAYQYDEEVEELKDESTPSRLFIYYNERSLEGTTGYDSGASIRDGMKTISGTGVCPETTWPYDITKFTEKPPENCYEQAEHNKATVYERVEQSEDQVKLAIKNGFPIVFGISVYSSFETEEVAKTGEVPMPSQDEKLLGGHAITLYGWDDGAKRFLFRNSWGTEWGIDGNGTLPYQYVLSSNLASDFWTVTKVSESVELSSPNSADNNGSGSLNVPPPSPTEPAAAELADDLVHVTAAESSPEQDVLSPSVLPVQR
jgi:C1A family cysteine protease